LPFFSKAPATPKIALLSDSDPPEVKTISSGLAPKKLAKTSRESSNAFLTSCPNPWILEALPNFSKKYGYIAFKTKGSQGVVAA